MRLIQCLWGLLLIVAVGLSGCKTQTPPATASSTTEETVTEADTDAAAGAEEATPKTEASSTVPPVPSATPLPEATATGTLVPANTPIPHTPTPTLTPTPDPAPVARINQQVTQQINVRSGPGTDYPVIDNFDTGEIAVVMGRNADKSWWLVNLEGADSLGWVFARLVVVSGSTEEISIVEVAPPPAPASEPETSDQVAEAPAPGETAPENSPPEAPAVEPETVEEPTTPEEIADSLRCGKDFCVTYQSMVPIWENGGCIGNHSIYVTVLEGPPPGKPMDGIVIGDTFNNIAVASGSKGPGAAEVTLWMNSMSLEVKRDIHDNEYTSEQSFSFTSHDELIPAEVLAANGYCEGRVEKCREAQQNNQVCRGHYSWRVTFHKFD